MISPGLQKKVGLAAVVVGNLVPLFGVMVWGWDIFSLFFLYWAENVVIGLYTVMAILCAGVFTGGVLGFVSGLFRAAFFTVHYGMFCYVHIFIAAELFGGDSGPDLSSPADILDFLRGLGVAGFYWALAGLAVAQGFQAYDSLRMEYAGKDSRKDMAAQIMTAPYGRIFVLHIAILLGGFLAQMLGGPASALAVLTGLKTLYDVKTFKSGEKDGKVPGNSQKI